MPRYRSRSNRVNFFNFFNFLTSDKISLTSDKKTAKGCWAVVLSSLSVMRLMGIDYLKRQVMVPSPLVVRLVGTAKRLLSDSRSQ